MKAWELLSISRRRIDRRKAVGECNQGRFRLVRRIPDGHVDEVARVSWNDDLFLVRLDFLRVSR